MKAKRIIAGAMCLMMAILSSGAVMAEQSDKISVIVDGYTVVFPDQEPVASKENRTMIPVRGVLEAMGATVEWRQDEQCVYVKAKDNIKRLKLYPNNPTMKKFTIKTVMTVDSEDVLLDSPPIVLQQRVLIPLRAISENIDADVQWAPETKTVTIQTKEYIAFKKSMTEKNSKEFNPSEDLPVIYLEEDGEYIDVKIKNADKAPENLLYKGLSFSLNYDAKKVQIEDIFAVDEEMNKVESMIQSYREDYRENIAKFIFLATLDAETPAIPFKDRVIARVKLNKLSEEETQVSLASYIDDRGYSLGVLVEDGETAYELNTADELYIDTEAITIK